MARNIFLTWLFVEKHYPNYYTSDEIAHNDDLSKLTQREYNEGDGAHYLLMEVYGGDLDNEQIEIDFQISCYEIYETALTAFVQANLIEYQGK